MGHAVVIQAYDYSTGLYDSLRNTSLDTIKNDFTTAAQGAAEAIKNNGIFSAAGALGALESIATGLSKTPAGAILRASSYQPTKKGTPQATISLFLPETLVASYDSSYSDISLTEELGIAGIVGNAMADASKQGIKNMVTPYATDIAARTAGKIGSSKLGMGQSVGAALSQAAGVVTNPQMQLLYRGISLRTFQLEFILTPKSPQEAKTVKDICDSFAFFSLPGQAGAQTGSSGQYLTPPQIFSIQFKFLGENTVFGNIQNVISSALTNSGLGFLTTGTKDISGAPPAKLFTINDCVLENVNVDYAPNGWAAYNDGYPVQTRLTLQFKETQMLTKENFKGSKVYNNYAPTFGSIQDAGTIYGGEGE
jgi:hypothetical protein